MIALLALLVLAAPSHAEDWMDGVRAFTQAREDLRPGQPSLVAAGRDEDGTLVLSSPGCAILERQAAALAEWRGRLGESARAPGACRCGAQGCSIAVGPVAPDFVSSYHGARAGRWGPNCWNAALVSSKILSVPGFTPPAEMTFWMESPLCSPLGAGEVPRPGDIIAIRDQAGEEVHGFVYLTEELSFSKNRLTAASAYALQSPRDVYGEFPVPDACRRPGAKAPDCPARADYFRCSSWEDYLRSSALTLPEDYLRAVAAVSEVERAVHELAFRWKTDPALRGRAGGILASARESLLAAQESARGRSGLAWRALELRIDGLLHQISLI